MGAANQVTVMRLAPVPVVRAVMAHRDDGRSGRLQGVSEPEN